MNLRQRLASLILGRTATAGWPSDLFSSASSAGQISKPYASSAWVHSAIQFVANPISGLPLNFTEDRRGGDIALDDPTLTAFWERPGTNRGGRINRSDFIAATAGWILLRGESFWIMDDTWLLRGAAKSPLILARPQDMTEITAGSGRELIGWHWLDGRGGKHTLIPAQVIQAKKWNPYDEIRGLADWQAAAIAADADYAAGYFARNLARNNGDRGPYVIGKTPASDDQMKQITAMLRQKREMAARGDFRAVFLTGDIEVREPSLQAVDAAYVSQRLENRKEVYAAFGVPPSFADSQASYSIGSASDRFKLIEETCMPLAAKIADAVEQASAILLGGGRTIFAEFDWDEHSTMQQVRGERFKSATDAIDRGMPWATASQYFRLGLPRFAGDTTGRVPYSLTPIEETTTPSEPSTPSDASDPLADLTKLFAARSATTHACPACASNKSDSGSAKWQQIHRHRRPWEKQFTTTARRLLMDARAETLRNIDQAEKLNLANTAATTRISATDLLFSLTSWIGKWTSALTGISRSAMERAGFEVWTDELQRTDPLTMPAQGVLTAVRDRENKISGAGEKIHEDLRREIEAAITAGDTLDQIRDRVRSTFNGISSVRVDMIARTETTAAYETARDMAFREAGVEWTQWLTMADNGDRHPSYSGLHNQIRPIDEPFTLYGNLTLRYPGDPEGPAAEVINCRCVRIAVAGPDPTDIEGNDPNAAPY